MVFPGLIFFLCSAAASAQSLLVRAEQAHIQGDLAAETKLLESAAASGAEEDRAAAERRLAWLAWRFYQDDGAARAHFDRAAALKAGLTETLCARARMETARARFDEARALARRALEYAAKASERDAARVAFAAATVEEAFESGKSAAAGEALDLISHVVREEPGRFVPSRLMYGLAMLLGDTARAREALRSYHWDGEPWPLYPEAGLAGAPPEAVTYSRFCRRVKQIADEHYRLHAIKKTDAPHLSLREPVLAEARKLWPEIASEEDLRRELSRRFNAEIRFERWGLAFGHPVVDENRSFEQYGRRTQVRFIVLDSMVSNGYVSWLSDGKSIIGGWAGPPMTQVRREDALRGWMAMTDPERKREFDRKIARASAEDDAAARKNPHGYLEGLMLRMVRRSHREILAALEATGLAGTDLRLAFLAECQRRLISCVEAHEARHLIEGSTTQGWRREMNAALSQVIFGANPVTCLAGILAPNTGNADNGSGEGNGRIMEGIVAWMKEHAGEIEGLDRSRPFLPQFDLLTDEQIRDAFRWMDPWGKEDPVTRAAHE